MEAFRTRPRKAEARGDNGSGEAFGHARSLLRREGFTVSPPTEARHSAGTRPADFLAAQGVRVVQVFVVADEEVDADETRKRVRAAYRRGETRVFVRWPLRWRMLSNVARWGLRGVAVTTW